MLGANNAIANYEFRYIDNKSTVYVPSQPIKSRPKPGFRGRLLYTTPFKCKSTYEVKNVMVGFVCKDQCMHATMHETLEEQNDECEPYGFQMCELQELCKNMRMPLIIIVNSWCSIENKTELMCLSYTGIMNSHVDDLFVSRFKKNLGLGFNNFM
jgi:hypothetical protein